MDETREGAAAAAVRVVGLGASAGGLEPLQQFLSGVPVPSGLAYVVVQHMDPARKALLGELLQRSTSMPVHEAVDGQRVEPDTVYVIPPDSELTLLRGLLRVAAPSRPRGQRLPIDLFLSSLAKELGDKAIGVVLSGMGSDGTRGLQAIASQGGATAAQRPDSAQFDSMPASAIATGCVDLVAHPADMPPRLMAMPGMRPTAPAPPSEPADDAAAALRTILEQLHQRTRHDFAPYKSNTQMRRIARRMALQGLDTMGAYAAFLRDNVQEQDLLFKEMLIGVTSFFRDPEVWGELAEDVLPALIERQCAKDEPLRAWAAGCSTGEEAYSIAMAFVEVAESLNLPAPCELQIFATDLNADAIAIARNGRYPATIAHDVAAPRLARFFSERHDGYQIGKRIRDMVLFAQHDVILDPPFTRVDLLSCRNLMIYFGASLQKRLVPLFHYGLRAGGALLLGSSETVGRAQSLFTPLHPKSRLYWRS
ncbi:MAG: chemotaxis protein CheB, partial [Burkholderiaceae bacterium]